jgi:uncharacterized protein (TIGR02757 family)
MMVIPTAVVELLNYKYEQYNRPNFIANDPVSIPHQFQKKQDIEIMGFWAAVLAWGQRKTIIQKCQDLVTRMDGTPHDFVLNYTESDLKRFLGFKHRTFNDTDTLYFLLFFQEYYRSHDSLEDAFLIGFSASLPNVESSLINFHNRFFDIELSPQRTRKHVATPVRGSSCKRLNMFLRWIVRNDDRGVDFGLWKRLSPSQLVCPCDVHVDRVARKLGLISRPTTDWRTAVELTEALKSIDPNDPVKYDFALFGLGVEGEM